MSVLCLTMRRNVVGGAAAMIVLAGCSSAEADRRDILLNSGDFPHGTTVMPLVEDYELSHNMLLDAPEHDEVRQYDPPECQQEAEYAVATRASLIDDAVGGSAVVDGERVYVVVVSETEVDVERVAEAHTGACAEYSFAAQSFTGQYDRSVRAERLPVPDGLEADAAAVIAIATNGVDDVVLGYASVAGHTVLVLSDSAVQDQFDEVFSLAVAKVAGE